MNYYLMWREERINTIRLISNNHKKILQELYNLENKYGLEIVLPFYDFVIDLLEMGESLNQELIIKYYNLYSKSMEYSNQNLSYTIQALRKMTFKQINEWYPFLKWYQKLWIKISVWFSNLFKYIFKE